MGAWDKKPDGKAIPVSNCPLSASAQMRDQKFTRETERAVNLRGRGGKCALWVPSGKPDLKNEFQMAQFIQVNVERL